MSKVYAWNKTEGAVVYRIPGHRHGDGQVDSDESPVWLLASDEQVADDGVDVDALLDVERVEAAGKLRSVLAGANLSQRRAARELDIDERTMRRYCSGELPVPRVVWLALVGLQKSA